MSTILIENFSGYFTCKSTYFSSHCTIDNYFITLKNGINYFHGDIDSQGFCLSYVLSMYKKEKGRSIILCDGLNVSVDNVKVDIQDVSGQAFYMDKLNALVKKTISVKRLVKKGLKKSGMNLTYEQVRDLFGITKERFNRPIRQVGIELYRCLAAIGFAYGKEVFCFPWLSSKMYNYYKCSLMHISKVLESYDKVIIMPTNANIGN